VGFIPANSWQDLSIASTRDPYEAQLIATIHSLHRSLQDLQRSVQGIQQTAEGHGQAIQTLIEKARLGEIAVAELQLGQKRNEDELYNARIDITMTRNDVSKVTEKQEKLIERMSAMQRGINCFQKLLGIRRFRQVMEANRNDSTRRFLTSTAERSAR
jgi:hypothetical protein